VSADTTTDGPDIALIGLALRVPGARDAGEFWRNLAGGVESLARLGEAELRRSGVPPSLLRDPHYVRAAMALDDVEMFDAGFFGLSPREAAIMDPQHRHFLEVCWEALEDAGHPPERFAGAIGLFAGSGMNAYMPYHLFTNPELMHGTGLFLVRHTGNDKDFLTTRASYCFNLRGPSVNVQTACSTSLVAIHYACQSLLSRECDLALAGGVTIELPHRRGYLYQEGEILSPDGHCRAFDHRSKGTVFGSGVGMVALRRLQDALADGDQIRAVIKGSAVNNDGSRKVGYLAPSVDGQAEAVTEALSLAGIDPETVTYLETHGTGTPVGDPIEITALTQAFRTFTARRGFCAIGSVKTNIGHLDTAAGVASLAKVVQMLQHRTLVPSLHYEAPNPQIDFERTPFYVNTATRPWEGSYPLRAAVNSLGVGGTNAHVVLEEAPARTASAAARGDVLLTLSARSDMALDRATARLADYLESADAAALPDVAYTLQVGRTRFAHRRVVSARSAADAARTLRALDPKRVFTSRSSASGSETVFLFPGGGAQYAGMAAEVYASEPVFRAAVDECLESVRRHEGIDLRPFLFPSADDRAAAAEALERPSLALPALLAVEIALLRQWAAWGVEPVAAIGHSLGEYAAAHWAGVFSLKDALGVVCCRGRLFETLAPGAMLSVSLSEAELAPLMGPGISIAAVNAPELCLVSGERPAVEALEAQLRARQTDCRRVRINVAAHSPMLEPILQPFAEHLRGVRFGRLERPFVSNVSGVWIRPEEASDPQYWVRHLRQPVRFAAGLATLLEPAGRVLLEAGPGQTLTSLARQHPRRSAAEAIVPSLPHPQEPFPEVPHLVTALGRLWAAGVDPDWKGFHRGERRYRVSLPTYPFEHQRHWIEPGQGFFLNTDTSEGLVRNVDMDEWFYRVAWRESEPSAPDFAEGPQDWLVYEDDAGLAEEVGAELEAAGHRVTRVRPGERFEREGDRRFRVRPEAAEDHAQALQQTGDRGRRGILHLWGVTGASARPSLDALDAHVTRSLLGLAALAQALGQEDLAAGVDLFVVTDGLQPVAGEAPTFPEKALSLGPARVIPMELPEVRARAIDLPVQERSSLGRWARRLLAELATTAQDAPVALRDDRRFVETMERAPLRRATPEHVRARLRERGVYLVTGGLGGIALSLAGHLAGQYRARLVLVSRTGLPRRDRWQEWLVEHDAHDAVSVRINKVRELEAMGAEVQVSAADCADLASMRAVVAAARERFGRIDGVVHAAGVLEDAPIAVKDAASMRRVIGPKVAGALVLEQLFREHPLDFAILFSSTSAALGPAGQIDYVAANAFLNALAPRLAQDGVAGFACALGWGVWQEVGMAVAAVTPPRPSGEGRPVAHPLLQRRRDHAKTVAFQAVLDPREQWVLDDHRVRAGGPVLPGTAYVEAARAAVAQVTGNGAVLEMRDLFFLAPLSVPDGETRLAETIVMPAGHAGSVLVRSRGATSEWTEHFTAAFTPHTASPAPGPLDVQRIAARCEERVVTFEPGGQRLPQDRHLAFGRRWQVLRELRFGRDEALARLELLPEHRADLATFAAHPGLLDMLSGFAFSLSPELEGEDTIAVPLSYARVAFLGPLPHALYSHVRHRRGTAPDLAAFDVTVADLEGRVVLEIEGYMVRPAPRRALLSADQARIAAEGKAPSLLAQWLEHGIAPAEGVAAFERVLAQEELTQVLVSPLDLHGMIDQVRRKREAAPAQPVGAQAPDGTRPSAPPRDDVDRALVELWQGLLGVSQVGIRDNFFELGGHSLIAVRLFARIKKQFEVDLPLAALFEAPTIEQCADLVRRRLGRTLEGPGAAAAASAPAGWSPLVAIQRGNGGSPFFCVHGAGGNLLNFRDLSLALGDHQPFYGLQAAGVDGQRPLAQSIEEMAEHYLAAVRQVQPHGPYRLGGYSGGGVVAYEMAQRLRDAGEETSVLVFLDTFHPGTSARSPTFREHLGLMVSEGLAYVQRRAKAKIARHVGELTQELKLRYYLSRQLPLPHELRDMQLTKQFYVVARRYQPRPYSGRVVMFRAQDISPFFAHVGSRLGWDELVRDLHVVEVSGNHDTLVLEPNVRAVGARLREELGAAAGRPGARASR
jgi:acyl transferase domain-containing protein/thioesterase domain-containing protein